MVITWINYIGVKLAGIVQTIVVATLLVIGALLVFGAGTGGSVANFELLFTDARGLFTVMVVVPFLFVGFDVIPQSAEELNMPPRRMGVMIIVSVAAATLWYIMVILTNASSMPREQLVNADLVTADAMAALFHSPAMANVLLVGGLAAASLNLMYLRDAIDRAAVVERLLPVLRDAAGELATAVAGLGRAA